MAGWVKWGLLGLALAYGGSLGLLFVGQRKLMYPAGGPTDDLASLAQLGYSGVEIASNNALRLRHLWRAPEDGAIVVYFHGNAGTAGDRVEKLRPLAAAGHGLLLVEYRGYGGNPGQPTETGLVEDGRAAVAWARAQAKEAKRPLILFGESLGTGLAVRLAAYRITPATG